MRYVLRAHWPVYPHLDEVPAFAFKILGYAYRLGALDPAFRTMRVPGLKGHSLDAMPIGLFARKIRNQGMEARLETRGIEGPDRRLFLIGSPDRGGFVDVEGDDALFADSDRLSRIPKLTIFFWSAGEVGIGTGRMDGDRFERLFWKRFVRPGSPIADLLPLTSDYATAEPFADGTLYTWPEWEPRLNPDRA